MNVFSVKLSHVDDSSRKIEVYVVAEDMQRALRLAEDAVTKYSWTPETAYKLMPISAIEGMPK